MRAGVIKHSLYAKCSTSPYKAQYLDNIMARDGHEAKQIELGSSWEIGGSLVLFILPNRHFASS